MEQTQFELIRDKHGAYGSWAVWAECSHTPKSNIADLAVLDPLRNHDLLEVLRPDVVMVGLNVSRFCPDRSFGNFHDPTPAANDFKIRFAFAGTPYWGAYMTDIIKGFVELESGRMMKHVASDPSFMRPHIQLLRDELKDLGDSRPVILAFGKAANSLLVQYLPSHEYRHLIPITHYSHRISKEKYRAIVHEQIASAGGQI